MSNKQKKSCTTLNYIEYFLNLVSTVTGCISISVFATSVGITSSAIGSKIFAIAAGIKKYKSIIKKKEKEAW